MNEDIGGAVAGLDGPDLGDLAKRQGSSVAWFAS